MFVHNLKPGEGVSDEESEEEISASEILQVSLFTELFIVF